MALNALVDSFCHNQKKCGTERVNSKELGVERRVYQADPADEGDDVFCGLEVKNLDQREADGHRQRAGCVDHWTSVDAVLSIVLHHHLYQSLLRRRVHRSTTCRT